MKIPFFLSILSILTVFAAEDNHGSHEAHVHGEAEMTLILQNDELAINFESPAANLVGFEHHPETDLQRNALDAVLTDLRNPTG